MPEPSKKPKAPSSDRLGALPDGVLELLPSRDAVRTCVLARRWRRLWMSVPSLRVPGGESVEESHAFLDHCLLLLRGQAPPSTPACSASRSSRRGRALRQPLDPVRRAVPCPPAVRLRTYFDRLSLNDVPLIAERLTHLKLHGLKLFDRTADFSGCPVLEDEDLQVIDCSCRSMANSVEAPEYLTDCHFGYLDERARISTPGNDTKASVLLDGLSAASCLELISDPALFLLRRELRSCPTFSNLKTLVLNEWCVAPDLNTLVCILQHTPLLQKLTLQLCEGTKQIPLTEASHNSGEQYIALKHIKKVQVKCPRVDERVQTIVDIIGTFGASLDLVDMEHTNILSSLTFFLREGCADYPYVFTAEPIQWRYLS
ncbi:hypothetical protein ACP4OV_020042 [Aristida adscensionis]